MKKEATIKRNQIYIGELIHPISIQKDNLSIITYRHLRSILFQKMQNNLAKDLLYDSPLYPILTANKDCLNQNILIWKSLSLDSILKTYLYKPILTEKDIINIRENIFSGENYLINIKSENLTQIKEMSDCILYEPQTGYYKKIDAFLPHKEEKSIRKRTIS